MNLFVAPNFESLDEINEFGNTLLRANDSQIDFSRVGFARPSGMVLLSQYVAKAVQEGRVDHFVNAEAYGYPANMGFYEACNLDVQKREAPGGANYLPVQKIDIGGWKRNAEEQRLPYGQLANQRVGRMAYLISRSHRGDLFELIKYCLREIVRNALEHSFADSLWIAGQYWPNSRSVELCIYDDGIGVRNAIVQNERFSNINSDRDAVRLSLLPSVSGSHNYSVKEDSENVVFMEDWGNSGFGLYVTSQIAKETGSFCIASGSYNLFLQGAIKRQSNFYLPGTYITMSFHVGELIRTASKISEVVEKGEKFAKRHLVSGVDVIASAASKFIIS